MEQQEAKNLLTFEHFLNSLEEIINGFEKRLESTNKRIDLLEAALRDLGKEIDKNTSIVRETKKVSLTKIENLEQQLSTNQHDLNTFLDFAKKEFASLHSEKKIKESKSSGEKKTKTDATAGGKKSSSKQPKKK